VTKAAKTDNLALHAADLKFGIIVVKTSKNNLPVVCSQLTHPVFRVEKMATKLAYVVNSQV